MKDISYDVHPAPSAAIDQTLEAIAGCLKADYGVSKRWLAGYLLDGDTEISGWVASIEPEVLGRIVTLAAAFRERTLAPPHLLLAVRRMDRAKEIMSRTVRTRTGVKMAREKVDEVLLHPFWGGCILLGVLYLALFKFVGVFAAGTVVNWMEKTLFGQWLLPPVVAAVKTWVSAELWQSLWIGEYGLITLGLRYAVALILPIVSAFFLVFSVIEDSGYLPRLSAWLDRALKKIGLSGRAVIPLVLGFGCVTMATMVTRTLPTKRERVLATLLLSLAIPCSAQFGVIMGVLAAHPKALAVWAVLLAAIFLAVGWGASRILPGQKPCFYMELPPLRMPDPWNVLTKTAVRVKWYLVEIIPLFLAASLVIWAGRVTGAFDTVLRILEHPALALGLPREAATVFLFGFFRRDYGAAGLHDLAAAGLLSGAQMLVACFFLTLFMPCVAQFLMTLRERGWRAGWATAGFVLTFSYASSWVLGAALKAMGASL